MMIRSTNRNRRARLAELEEIVLEHFDSGPTGPISPPEWLEHYRAVAKTGFFRREPDFEATIATYAQMLEAIPPSRHLPTDDFEPDESERQRMRLWQIRHSIRELDPVERKLSAMVWRAAKGLDGVSEAEFAQKKAWFEANKWELPMHFMIAEDGTTEPRNNTVETVLYVGTTSSHLVNAMAAMREWEKGNIDKCTTYGEWRRKRELEKQ